MAKFLSDQAYAVRGRLVAIDNAGLVGPFIVLRVPPTTFDVQRPASYMDFRLLDPSRKTLQKRINVDDELEVILHAFTASAGKGTRNELTFQVEPKGRCQRISHTVRCFDSLTPVNGKVVDSDGRNMIVVDAGFPVVVSLLEQKRAAAKEIKVNSWITFWPSPPTHGVVLGKV